MEVIQTPDSKWAVVDANGNVIATYETNAEAWRAFDRAAGEAETPRQALVDWVWKKQVSG